GPAPAPTIARATENPPASGPAELAPYSPQQQGTRRREQHPEYTDPGEVSSIGPACRPWERGPRHRLPSSTTSDAPPMAPSPLPVTTNSSRSRCASVIVTAAAVSRRSPGRPADGTAP